MATTTAGEVPAPDPSESEPQGPTRQTISALEIRTIEEHRASAADIYMDGAIGFMMNNRNIVKFGLYQEVIEYGSSGGATRHIVARIIMHRETAIESQTGF